jgi:threonine dehydrogenase-like Zn-dependent dehydrogenase
MVHPIPDAVSFEDGAMMEPLSVGVHSVANLGEFKSDQVSQPSNRALARAANRVMGC